MGQLPLVWRRSSSIPCVCYSHLAASGVHPTTLDRPVLRSILEASQPQALPRNHSDIVDWHDSLDNPRRARCAPHLVIFNPPVEPLFRQREKDKRLLGRLRNSIFTWVNCLCRSELDHSCSNPVQVPLDLSWGLSRSWGSAAEIA